MGKLAMGREVKIGLAVIGSLMLVLGAVLYKQLTRTPDVPILAAGDKDVPTAKAPLEIAKRPFPGADRFAKEDPAASRNHKWLSASASEPAADQARDAGDPPRRSFLPSVKDELPHDAQESADDRYGAAAREPEVGHEARQTRREPAARRDPFNRPQEVAPAEIPLEPGEDSRLAPGTDDLRELPREGSPQSSSAPRPAQATLTAAEERPRATVGRDEDAPDRDFRERRAEASDEERPHNRLRDNRTAREPQPTIEDDAPQQREFPPLTGRIPEGRPLEPVPTANVENGYYTVQPNDNYWIISEKVYGTGGYFKAIHQHNRGKFPQADKLQVGDKLSAPTVDQLEKEYPDLCPKRRHVRPPRSATITASAHQRVGGKIYVVQEGDTLFDIARYQLGKATRWAEIYELNRDSLGDDMDFLQPGTELTLPGSPREEESVTRRRGSTERR